MEQIDWVYKTKPFKHQHDVFMESRDKEFYALLMEMGTGKTFVTLNTAAWLYAQGKIDLLFVIAPNGVHRIWVDQTTEHIPDYVNAKAAFYSASASKEDEKKLKSVISYTEGLRIISINVESLTTGKGMGFIQQSIINNRCMLVIDESSTIKNPKAIRTKNLLKIGRHAKYRRILTGTPVTQGPLDLYTQFTFLDPHILHCGSYFAFRGQYALMKDIRISGGRFIKVVDRYCNLEHLQSLINPHSYRVTKKECLDLPDKLYVKRYVELTANQRLLYKELAENTVAEFEGKSMSAPLALTKLMRLQQIVGGFFVPDGDISHLDADIDYDMVDRMELPSGRMFGKPPPEPIDKINPRIESLIELLEETSGKVIIWARFRAEIAAISNKIAEVFGRGSYVEYHGGIDNKERSEGISLFQTVDKTRFFVGHVQAGGKGITLHAASTVVYFSNDFSLENRLQSEDRAHRIGQKNDVLYVDMIAVNTLDNVIVDTLRDKKNVADLITGDNITNWI